MTRRDLLRLLLASAAAEAVDFERLLWTPKPIVTVPAMPEVVFIKGLLRRDDLKFTINWLPRYEKILDLHGMRLK